MHHDGLDYDGHDYIQYTAGSTDRLQPNIMFR
jgi:hypothetical protein